MNKLKTIITGVDFSDCSRSALEQAVRMAKWNNANLRMIHVIEDLVVSEAAEAMRMTLDQIRNQAREQAIGRLGLWARETGAEKNHSREVHMGSPLDGLLQECKTSKADLLVLGVTGDSLLPYGAGNLATKCLRKAPCKVMLVRPGHARPFRRIVACVDFSETSREAVVQALRVASQDQAEVHFLHVFTGSWGRYLLVPDAWEVDPQLATQYRQALEQKLRDFVGNTGERQVHFAVTEAGNHGHGIAEYARRVDADLVVLGSKGRSNLTYVLLGSTVERLVREIPCSALVVKPPA
ncbi:MAG: universal stress protein [Verrucomicrobia bacterium]|nr:universal stress protein [Verrucomicrobiota bacterium]